MIESIQQIDSQIFIFFNSFHNGYFDNFMALFSGRFIWIPMYAALLLMMMRRYAPLKLLFLLIGIALSITLADQICASLIRPLFHRLRPSNIDNPLSVLTHIVNGYRGGAYGFPSCHAANSFALATFAAAMLRQRSFSVFIFSWATINCYSRIYLGVHYPGDLLVGAIIGALVGLTCYIFAQYLYTRVEQHNNINQQKPILSIDMTYKGINAMEIVGFITLLTIILVSFA